MRSHATSNATQQKSSQRVAYSHFAYMHMCATRNKSWNAAQLCLLAVTNCHELQMLPCTANSAATDALTQTRSLNGLEKAPCRTLINSPQYISHSASDLKCTLMLALSVLWLSSGLSLLLSPLCWMTASPATAHFSRKLNERA